MSRPAARSANAIADCKSQPGLAEPAAIFDDFAAVSGLVLAVSGGPDSMALMHLAAHWAAGRQGPALHVVTIDHGLRAAAADEAAFVADAATTLGLSHTILRWTGPKPATRIQERARAARYALLAVFARSVGATHVATAHHADDQAETVLMRLGRGSGIGGLSGMRSQTELAPGIQLVRPLLHMTKAELVAVCERQGQAFVDDPTNADPAFARARLRQQAGAAAVLGLRRDTLLRLARRMARAEAALNAASLQLEATLAPAAAGSWRANLSPARDAAPELLQRVLRRAIATVVGSPVQVGGLRLDRLEALADQLHAAIVTSEPLRATLGGARIVLSRDASITVTPEPTRRRGRLVNGAIGLDPAAIKAELPRAFASLGK